MADECAGFGHRGALLAERMPEIEADGTVDGSARTGAGDCRGGLSPAQVQEASVPSRGRLASAGGRQPSAVAARRIRAQASASERAS